MGGNGAGLENQSECFLNLERKGEQDGQSKADLGIVIQKEHTSVMSSL